MKGVDFIPDVVARFWLKVVRGSGCWSWTGTTDKDGYGRLVMGPTNVAAHRVSWALHHGEVPGDTQVLHECDNPPCVRPDHLFLGTNIDNRRDMVAKGRALRGMAHHNAKLNEHVVRAIRTAANEGERRAAIAARYGITRENVRLIVTGKAWAHVG